MSASQITTFILLHKHVCFCRASRCCRFRSPHWALPTSRTLQPRPTPRTSMQPGPCSGLCRLCIWDIQGCRIPSANRKYHSCVQIQESVEEHSRQKRLEGGNQCAHFQGQKHQESLRCKSFGERGERSVAPFRRTCLRMEVQTTLRRPNPITSTWIIWALGWVAAACRSAFLFERVKDIPPCCR